MQWWILETVCPVTIQTTLLIYRNMNYTWISCPPNYKFWQTKFWKGFLGVQIQYLYLGYKNVKFVVLKKQSTHSISMLNGKKFSTLDSLKSGIHKLYAVYKQLYVGSIVTSEGAVQWNLISSFPWEVLKKNDGYGKMIDVGAYIKWIKTVTFAYMYLLNQKTYTNDIISTVKSNLHYLFLKKSLIHICLVAPFFFKLNNNRSILMTFTWSLMVIYWPYMNALIDWNNTQANKKQ
jgi:hypothetical protein